MKKPNVILIHADQHRWDCLGCFGNPDVKTPHLDTLAANGTRYAQHYTVFPVCTPSRYSMLSGLYTHQHTAWTNQSTLPAGTATFPRLLRDAGYHTAAVGKMHFTPTYLDLGFERMLLAEQNGDGRYEDDYHAYLKAQGLVDQLDLTDQVDEYRQQASPEYYQRFGAYESDLPIEHHSTSWITRQALTEIEGWQEDTGNLLMVGYVKPHHPFDPPAPYSTMYDPASVTIPEGWLAEVPEWDYENSQGFFDSRTVNEEALRRVIALYYGTITQIDDGVGEILSCLQKKGLYENTMIIYTSDHGEYLGFHHMLLKGNYLYDPLAHIPLIIKYPNQTAGGQTLSGLCENIDLAATVLSCCGVAPDPAMGQATLLSPEREFVFSECQFWRENRLQIGYMIRSKSYKLLVRGSMEDALFFDLSTDPYEQKNEIANPAYIQEIRRHQSALIDRVLFSGGGRNHVDFHAPQILPEEGLERRAEELRSFIREKIQVF